jgi:hypothetical protein
MKNFVRAISQSEARAHILHPSTLSSGRHLTNWRPGRMVNHSCQNMRHASAWTDPAGKYSIAFAQMA